MIRLALAAAVALVGCDTAVPPPVPTPDRFKVVIPSGTELIPSGVAGATDWSAMPGLPDAFDARLAYPSAIAAGDALAEAIADAGTGVATVRVDPYRASDELALLVVTVSAAADDSVAGSQYAMDMVHEPDGWVLYQIWIRILCRCGVAPGDEFCVGP